MQNGRLRATQLMASSMWDKIHGPTNARLHWRRTRGRTGAWSARHNNRYQWLQVDFGRPVRITKIATQGRQDTRQWVTQYYVTFSQDGAHFAEYKENSNRKVMIMIMNLYSANSMWHMFKCALQLACMRSNRKHWRYNRYNRENSGHSRWTKLETGYGKMRVV